MIEPTANGTNVLSLNGSEESTKTKAQLKAEEIAREANALIREKKYGEAIKMLKSMPNKERREYKATIARLKQLEVDDVTDAKQWEEDAVARTKTYELEEIAHVKQLERKKNEESGDYDMVSIFHEAASNPKAPLTNHSEFFGPVEKRWISDQKGFGVVATRDVEAGELMIASKAICIGFFTGSLEANLLSSSVREEDEFVDNITKSVTSNERYAQEFYSLYAGEAYPRNLPSFNQRSAFIRQFQQKFARLEQCSASPKQMKSFYIDSVASFRQLAYKGRYDTGLGSNLYWFSLSPVPSARVNGANDEINNGWFALTGENSGDTSFVSAPNYELLLYCVWGLVILPLAGNAKGPEAKGLASKLLNCAKIEYGSQQALEFVWLMEKHNSDDFQSAIQLARQLLQIS